VPVYSGMMPGCMLRTGGPMELASSRNKFYDFEVEVKA